MRRLIMAGLALAIVALWSSPATAASITVYSNDLSGWQAATTGEILEDFADTTLVPGFSITFGTALPGSISGGEYHDRTYTPFDPPVLHFSPGVSAFGADWDLAGPGGEGSGIDLFVTFLDNSTQTVAPKIPSSFSGEFYGIVSDMAFKSIRIDTDIIETFDMDDARLANMIPEPSTLIIWSLLGTLGMTLGWWRRKRKAA